jgi:hypothetical protein
MLAPALPSSPHRNSAGKFADSVGSDQAYTQTLVKGNSEYLRAGLNHFDLNLVPHDVCPAGRV